MANPNTQIGGQNYTHFPRANVSDQLRVKGRLVEGSDSVVRVYEASDLAGTLDSTKAYIIDGNVDMGSTSIVVPEDGLFIQGLGFGISSLTSSENNTDLFVTAPTYSGDLFINGLDIQITGTSSRVFGDLDNLENSNAVEFIDTNFIACTSLGNIKDYRQLLTSNVAFIAIADGLTFDGAWSGGAAILQTIMIDIGAGVSIFKEGASLVFGAGVRSDLNANFINATTILFDFQASNFNQDGSFSLTNVRVNPLATGAIPNISAGNVKARFRNCSGFSNTYVGSTWEVTSGATTTISADNTLVKMAGTTTYADEEWFSNAFSNTAVYESSLELKAEIEYSLSFTGGNNDVVGIQIRHWDDSASAYVNVGARITATLNAENVTGFAYATMNENDRIEVWVENQTDNTNITTDASGSLFIKERSS